MRKRIIRVLLIAAMSFIVFPATVFAAEEVAISETNFPDATFRNYVSDSFDWDASGTLSSDEITAVTNIDVSNKEIVDLKGLEYFVALTHLTCNNNMLTVLDVSQNTELIYIYCGSNVLTDLDLSQNTALTHLYSSNNNLSSLDVSKNTSLTHLFIANNELSSLNVSNNTALKYLVFYNNNVSSLDVSKNSDLMHLHCTDNVLTNLDLSKNTALTNLKCANNMLGSLDVSKNTALTYLDCCNSGLSSLDISNNTELLTLYCVDNLLTELDLSNNTALTDVSCKNNNIYSLDVSNNTALINLECSYNELTGLDVSKNTEITNLYFAQNRLTSIDLSNNTKLEKVYYGDNSYDIVRADDGSFDLSTLPAGFDVSRASNWEGGTVSGTILTVDADTTTITYDYDCGNETVLSFKLNIVNHIYGTPEYQWSEDNATCSTVFYCSYCEDTQTIPCTVTMDALKRKLVYTATCEFEGKTYTDVKVTSRYKVTEIFSDVEDIWYVPYIQYAYDNELMDGTGEATFAPDSPLTRAMFVQILYAQEGKPEIKEATPFLDLTEDWYQNAVKWAYKNNVVSGKIDTIFAPNENVTREQLAVILYAYDGKPGIAEGELAFPDAEDISDYAVEAITWAVQNGIMSGKDVNGTLYLEPKGRATRAEAATMLMQYLEK